MSLSAKRSWPWWAYFIFVIWAACAVALVVTSWPPDQEDNRWAEPWVAFGTWALVGSTLFLGFFTYRLWSETRDALAQAKTDAEQAREQTQRALTLNKPPSIRTVEPKMEIKADTTLEGRILLINEGGTTADFVKGGSWLIVRCLAHLPQMHPIHDLQVPYPHPFEDRDKLQPGDSAVWKFEGTLTSQEVADIESDSKKLYIMGLIRYVDTIGNLHTAKFTRCYDRAEQRYFPLDDPDYSSRT